MAKDALDILARDDHLIQSFADLNALKQQGARTVISRAKGAYVYDSDGTELIDGIGGLWCVNIGHGNAEMIDAITDQLKTLGYYSTFYNFTHPAAAGLTNIAIMEREGIPERVRTTGKRFENNLRGLTDIELVGEVRGSHFMMGIEFVKDRDTKESYPDDAQVGLKVARACQKRGLIARPLGNVRSCPQP